MLMRIHANVYALPAPVAAGPRVVLRGREFPTLGNSSGGPPRFDATLPVTFEAMQQQLLTLPRSDCEPDGFFLVTGGREETFWRLNGHMHELGAAMHRVELNGECPEETFDAVLKTMAWPGATLVFELVQEGVTLGEAEFRAWAVLE